MYNIVRNVRDIDTADRRALEHVIGQHLAENQQLVIHVVNMDVSTHRPACTTPGVTLPDWCNVYEGLSDEEVSALEEVVLTRADLSRDSESAATSRRQPLARQQQIETRPLCADERLAALAVGE